MNDVDNLRAPRLWRSARTLLATCLGAMLLVACREPPAPSPVVANVAEAGEVAASSSTAEIAAGPERFRAVVELVPVDDGSGVARYAAVPLLCHDGEAFVAERGACVRRLGAGVNVVGEHGAWPSSGKVITVPDRDYQGVLLANGAQGGLGFSGFETAPAERCRRVEENPPALDAATWARLSPKLPNASSFAGGYPGNVRHVHVFAADFDGDGQEDRLSSITLEQDGARLDLVTLKRKANVEVLGSEWSVGSSFGGEPARRLVDVRSLSCFDMDDRPGLEMVASMRAETEREHLAWSFAGATLLPVGHAVFFGD